MCLAVRTCPNVHTGMSVSASLHPHLATQKVLFMLSRTRAAVCVVASCTASHHKHVFVLKWYVELEPLPLICIPNVLQYQS